MPASRWDLTRASIGASPRKPVEKFNSTKREMLVCSVGFADPPARLSGVCPAALRRLLSCQVQRAGVANSLRFRLEQNVNRKQCVCSFGSLGSKLPQVAPLELSSHLSERAKLTTDPMSESELIRHQSSLAPNRRLQGSRLLSKMALFDQVSSVQVNRGTK